jgi:hypothetical protein
MNSSISNYRHDFKFGLRQRVNVPHLDCRGVITECVWNSWGNVYTVRIYTETGIDNASLFETELEEVPDDN